jgi:hypothetical protein
MRRFQLGLLACLLPAFVLSLALTGCGGGDKDKTTTSTSSTDKGSGDKGPKDSGKGAGKAEPIEASSGVVKGKVTVKVTDDLKKILAMDNKEKMKSAKIKAEDQEVCLKGDMLEQSWKVDDKGGVANVFVWLAPPQGKFFAVDPAKAKWPDTVIIDQPHCAFEPHVAWVIPSFKDKDGKTQTSKQKVVVKNSAPMGHNTKWGDVGGQGDNLTLAPGKEMVLDIKPTKDPITLSCSIHTWMNGYIRAFDHPYVAITDKDGNFEIKGAPTGKLHVVAWHEVAEYITPKNGVEIDVKDGDNSKDFEISPDKVKP